MECNPKHFSFTMHKLFELQASNTTPKCVLVHFGFHSILNEFVHFYHDEIGQPPNE